MGDLQIRAVSAPWHSGVEFLLRQGDAVATNVTFTDVGPGEYVAPLFTAPVGTAQTLMDDLWAAGLRPTEGTGSAGSLRATENHLKDMQRLVFNKLESGE